MSQLHVPSASRVSVVVLTLFLSLGLAGAPPVQAQMEDEDNGSSTTKIGPRIGVPVGDVSDLGGNLFLGLDGRARTESLPEGVVLSPSIDFYLTDDFSGASLTVTTLDLNGFYEFRTENPTLVPYLGGGIAVTLISIDEPAVGDPSSTEFGINLVGGARFPLGPVEPFAQVNVAAGADRIGIGGGVLFGI